MIKKLQYRFSRTKIDPGAIEDVYDGELYKKHSCPPLPKLLIRDIHGPNMGMVWDNL